MSRYLYKSAALFMACIVALSVLAVPASAALSDALEYAGDSILQWMNPSNTEPLGGWNIVDFGSALFQSNKEQKYYTEPTESVEDSKGNVINYYRGGDTTSTKIIDSYNRTFNTIHNTTNNTNNYSANVKLNDFLNSYTTNNNNYQYTADLKSWYYDNDTNNYNYTSNQTYYNTDNSRYYVSIDNSTDEYYLIDVQYSPTFVTVNYEYNTTNNNITNNYGDVTNVYYYELDDGRNSYTLTVSEALGIATGYDVVNYELVPDDPDTLALLHFDGNYDDSSAYGRAFYSENRSTSYVDSGDFNKAVKLPSGSAAGVNIPGLTANSSLQIDFRAYFDDISSMSLCLGSSILLGDISPHYWDVITSYQWDNYEPSSAVYGLGSYYGLEEGVFYPLSYEMHTGDTIDSKVSDGYYNDTVKSQDNIPISYNSDNFYLDGSIIGYGSSVSAPSLFSTERKQGILYRGAKDSGNGYITVINRLVDVYKSDFNASVVANSNFGNLKNQWVAFRIVISGGKLFYFVNGDLVGSGAFSMPSADKIYIKSAGTVYLDELRVSTGSLVSTSTYNPAATPYDTNMVLALPDTLTPMTIYVRHQTPVNGWRIGGVRPSAPATGFFYLPLHSDYTGAQPQLYDGSNWVDVDAVVSPDGVSAVTVIGYRFTPAGAASDVDPDLQPGRPDDGSGDVTSCQHSWEETGRIDATCDGNGSISYACTKCSLTKSELISAPGHIWSAAGTVQTEYDDAGNVTVQGYTLYKCSVCGTEYKDMDGSGPPSSGTDDKEGLLSKLFVGLFDLIGTIIGTVLDGLISLATSVIERVTSVVNLFGSFGESLSVLWSWLPDEIVTVFVTGVTIVVFASIIKLFVK